MAHFLKIVQYFLPLDDEATLKCYINCHIFVFPLNQEPVVVATL